MKITNIYYRCFQRLFDLGARCLPWPRPKNIVGKGCVREIPKLFQEQNVDKVMVITGRTVGKSLAPAVLQELRDNGINYYHYSEVPANPTVRVVREIKEKYLENGCRGFLAIGGGSPIDAAKGAAACIVRPKKEIGDMAGLFKVRKKLPLFVAVPTTAGSGSETTIAAVITDSDSHHKYAVMDLCLMPDYAVMDPELMVTLPPHTTSTTGMDALTHAVEAYLCRSNRTKESDRLAEEATVLIFGYLERAYRDGTDLEARQQMLLAANKAGFAFGRSGVGNVHAIAHTLGGLYNTPHGLANAVILPLVLEDYGSAVYKKLARLSELTGVREDGTEEEKAKAFIAEIRAMNRRMDIPEGFADLIREEDIPQMVSWADAEANPIYPVPVIFDKAHFERIIRRIMR